MEWIKGFLIPLIEIIFFMGVGGWIAYMIGKGFHNAWTKSFKFIWKYKIRKKEYPEKKIQWIFDCIYMGVGWHDAKKFLMVKMFPQNEINEIMWIYDQIIIELNEENKEKGGNNGKQFKRSNSKNESTTEIPTISI